MKPAPGSVVLEAFRHEAPRLEPLRGGWPTPMGVPQPAVHQFELRLLVAGDENAHAVMAMLRTWLDGVGAPIESPLSLPPRGGAS